MRMFRRTKIGRLPTGKVLSSTVFALTFGSSTLHTHGKVIFTFRALFALPFRFYDTFFLLPLFFGMSTLAIFVVDLVFLVFLSHSKNFFKIPRFSAAAMV